MTTSTITVSPLTSAVGAEITGLDLRQELDGATVSDIKKALNDHLVLFFRDQDVAPEDQLRFCQIFGPLKVSEFSPNYSAGASLPPGLTVIDQNGRVDLFTDTWHTDHTFTDEIPTVTVLRSVQIPSKGGDTCFANMCLAYDALSPQMQTFLEGLTAVHTSENQLKLNMSVRPETLPEAVHPVITVHPETGRKLIFVNVNYTQRIVELTADESAMVLKYLFDHVKQPQLQCRFRWTKNAIAVWDNRAAQHCAVYDYTERRVMHRCLAQGVRPVGVHG